MLRLPELHAAIAEVPALAGVSVRQPLPGGLASESWLVGDRGKLMVVRVDTPLAGKLKLDRCAELEVLETVSAAGIGPDLIWADPAAGLLVTGYIPEPVWTEKNVHDPARLQNLAVTLQRLHDLPAAGPGFDPARAARTYATTIGGAGALRLAEKTAVLCRQLLTPGHRRAVCHNDLVYMNIVGSHPVRLIDWEYAAAGDPLFDLAVVVRHHRLTARIAGDFLRAYMGPPDAETSERFDAFCQLYDLLAELWYLAVAADTQTTDGELSTRPSGARTRR